MPYLLHSTAWPIRQRLLALVIACAFSDTAQAACSNVLSLTTAKPTVIYAWSPRMVGAVHEAAQAQQAALQNGAAFVPVLDPRVSAAQAMAALQRHPAAMQVLKPTHEAALCAEALPEQAFDHAPTLYVAAHGKLHPHRIIGVMPREAWRDAIALRLVGLAGMTHDGL